MDINLQPSSGISQLFSNQAYSNLIERIFFFANTKSISRLLRVNKYVNELFISSTKLQFHYRQIYHGLPDYSNSTADTNKGSQENVNVTHNEKISTMKKLELLLEKEERLDLLKPSTMKCIHIPHCNVFEFKKGFLLIGECTHKIPSGDPQYLTGYHYDSWSIWKTNADVNQEDVVERGAHKHQGYYRWKIDQGENTYITATMCLEDNVIAVVKEIHEIPCSTVTESSTESTYVRIYLYQLIPPIGTEPPPKGTFQGATRHPETASEFIEIKLPAKFHAHKMKVELGPNGKLGIGIKSEIRGKFNFIGFWDWKKGVSLGAITPSPHMRLAEDFRFFGNFVIATIFRMTTHPPQKPKSKDSKVNSIKRRRANARFDKMRDRQYQVRGRTTLAEPRDLSGHDSCDEEEEEVDLRKDLGASIDTFELYNSANGKKPSPFAHKSYTDPDYNPNEPCTWEYQDIPICAGITSHLTPFFKSVADPPAGIPFMDLPIPPSAIPLSCILGDIHIDDALLKGERDGAMSLTISMAIGGSEMPSKCQMAVDLREIINQMTIVLTDRIKNRDLDPRQLSIQTKSNTMWSNDPSVQKSLNRQLGLDCSTDREPNEKGWETDPDDADLFIMWSRHLRGKDLVNQKMGEVKMKKSNMMSKKYKDTRKRKHGHNCMVDCSKCPVHGPISEIDTTHYAFNIYPAKKIRYEEWEKSCSFRFSFASQDFSSFGTRMFATEPDYKALKSLPRPPGRNEFAPMKLIMRDYNRNLLSNTKNRIAEQNDHQNRFTKPLGASSTVPSSDQISSSTKKFNSYFSASPLPKEYKKSFENYKDNLEETVFTLCKLPKPIALPKLIRNSLESSSSKYHSKENDNKIYTVGIFNDQFIKSNLNFRESKIDMKWDMKRNLLDVFFDGNSVVLHMQNGATIMDFTPSTQ
ncbi:uncharacterized protein L201_004019 [Kwoniella dendrophila CBS 6074]|uniref:F-box domain-containing protein n=1 Tax=Kwoniella dendrophila CBS 6074 TaxID=1295534 RepID=A0AAX4JUI8_9TREE